MTNNKDAQPAAPGKDEHELTPEELAWIHGKNNGEPLVYEAAPSQEGNHG